MPDERRRAEFPPLFDRSVTACVCAEVLVRRSASAAALAREMRASSLRMRTLVRATRDYWATADLVYSSMRRQLEQVAATMRAAGLDQERAAAEVRARVRFVLYDGGFGEIEVEPVVQRASLWVEELFEAA
jgi:hypothetical protein